MGQIRLKSDTRLSQVTILEDCVGYWVLTSLKPFIHPFIQKLFNGIYLIPDAAVSVRATGIDGQQGYMRYIYFQPSTSLHTSGIER